MGAHRFTLLEKNAVVAATDFPDSNDRLNQKKTPKHYSRAHVTQGVYGLNYVYVDNVKANEEIRINVEGDWSYRRFYW